MVAMQLCLYKGLTTMQLLTLKTTSGSKTSITRKIIHLALFITKRMLDGSSNSMLSFLIVSKVSYFYV